MEGRRDEQRIRTDRAVRAPPHPGGRDVSRIEDVRCRLFRVPLSEVLVDAKHGSHSHFELITVTIRDSDGGEGTGYTYTGGRGGGVRRGHGRV